MRKKGCLSYGEIAIIAVVLGVCGRMIAPQFCEAGIETKVSALIERLEVMRAQLDLYRVQHGESLPPTDSFASFETAMTRKLGQYGPYVEKIPTNPFNKLKRVRFDGEAAGAGKAGWRLDTKTGLFQADSEPDYAAL
ncbi:MAG: hypothetical protein ACYSSO_04195 [Planctomycetota bacterium]|jgi:hypothetical protein